MSLLPAKAYEKLVCTECYRYLRFLPIKIYPGLSIKCRECSEENDGGTVSILYETIAKYFQFPCINRYQGCKELLHITSVHDSCICRQTTCMLCECGSVDDVYSVVKHIKVDHKDLRLTRKSIWIELANWNSNKIKWFFYTENNDFLLIGYKYNFSENQVEIYFETFEDETLATILYTFKFHFGKGYHEIELVPSNLDNKRPPSVVDLNSFSDGPVYPKSIFCEFELFHKNADVSLSKPSAVLNGALRSARMTFKFSEISQLEENERAYSDFSYWMDSRLWRLAIAKINHEGVPFLEVSLYQVKNKSINKGLYEADVEVTLISHSDQDMNYRLVDKLYFKEKWNECVSWKLLNWHTLVDVKQGYLTEDSIEFEFKLEASKQEK